MEFEIPQKFLQPYIDNSKEIINERSQKGYSSVEILKEVKKYYSKNRLELISSKEDFNSCCYEFALNELKINPANSLILNEFQFANFINSNDMFKEVESKREIKPNQLVVYYFNPNEYLHAGVIKSVNFILKVISQWGDKLKFKHPIGRIDNTYGNKYKIFKIDRLKNSERYVDLNKINAMLNEIWTRRD